MAEMKNNGLYQEDIKSVLNLNCNFFELKKKTILITGATGLIGSVLVDMFVFLSKTYKLDLYLLLISRTAENFSEKFEDTFIQHIKCDVANENLTEKIPLDKKIDFIFHLASNTHPDDYSKYPIETILINFNGTKRLLDIASKNLPCRFILASSVEVYGDDKEKLSGGFKESDFGYLDCNTMRACYNESKRISETLCQAYKAEKDFDVVIARIARSYGATLKKNDTKALSQFLRCGLNNENIILKSSGEQYFSYIYSSDVACALVFLMLKGKCTEAYNIADKKSNIHLKDLAKLVAKNCNVQVAFDIPEETEKAGYSRSVRAILNTEKINTLGWSAKVSIEEGIKRTIKILQDRNYFF
ncbi:MAG TPA: dTDP-glucose 4,6-dehydratase [Treponema sp.]|nr:dTDP-glucose 4,6-dehydratase [Treponema sp.]HBP09179.1 dTDP-glucose 4,6-dehydratase [Treponema sp.]